jgi:hypothetical protein
MLCLLMAAGLALSCGEDKVKQAPPKPPPSAGVSNARPNKAGANQNVGTVHAAGAVKLEEPVPVKAIPEEEVPAADPSKVHAFLFVSDPVQAKKLLETVDPSLLDDDLNHLLARAFGLPALSHIDWSKPMLIALVEGSPSPVVMVSTLSTDEFLTPLPPNPIRNRQGNDFSFPLSMTQTVYLNFIGQFAVLSGEWRHFPLVSGRLKEIIEEKHDAVMIGEAQVHEFDLLSRRISRLPAPLPELAPGWNDFRVTLEDLIDTTQSVAFKVQIDGEQTAIEVRLSPKESGLFSKMVAQLKAADTSKSIGRLALFNPRFWLWQNLAQAPLIAPGAPIALVSHTLRALTPEQAEPLFAAELARAAALLPSNLLAIESLDKSNELRWVSIAEVRDVEAFDKACNDRFELLDTAKRVQSLKIKAFGKLNQPDALHAFQLLDSPRSFVEARYANDFVAVSQRDPEEAARLVSLIAATPPSSATMPVALQAVPGVAIMFAAFDLKGQGAEPMTASVAIDSGALVLRANIPRAQLDLGPGQ